MENNHPPHYSAAIHSVRKPPSKPRRRQEQPPPRVYHVEPRRFRRLVQQLTGASLSPQAASRPLRQTAPTPPPLELAPRAPPPMTTIRSELDLNDSGLEKRLAKTPNASPRSLMGLFSPGFLSGWCFSQLLSPGTVAAIDHGRSAVL